MTFDYTNGKTAKYMVSLYSWNVEDKFVYASYEEALARFNREKVNELNRGVYVSLYDMVNDVKKEHIRVKGRSR